MTTEFRTARMSIPEEWQRTAFDALMLPVFDLELTDKERNAYAKQAAKAARRVTWMPYDTARQQFMDGADELLEVRPLALPVRNHLRWIMYIRYMENRIRYYQEQEQRERCLIPPVEVGENDLSNTEMAMIFAHLPPQPETEQWLKDLNVSWTYDQLHMVSWFSSQLSLGGGEYSRTRPNHSAKVTYERLLNPFSLLWIAAALGVEKDLVVRTRREMEGYLSWRAKCGVVRRAIPWNRIYKLALPLAEKERKQGYRAG